MKTYIRILSYLLKHPLSIAVTWVLSILTIFLKIVSVWIGATLLEMFLTNSAGSIAAQGETAFITQWLDRHASDVLHRATPYQSLLVAVGIVFGSQVLASALRICKLAIFARVNQLILVDIRSQMFAHLTECDLAFHRRYRYGETASLFLRDVDQLNSAFIDSVDRLFMQPMRLIVGIGLMAMLAWQLTIVILFVLILAGIFIHFAGNRLESRFRAVSEKRSLLQGHLVEYLSTVIIARALGREQYEREHFDALCQDLRKTVTGAVVINGMTPMVVSSVFLGAGAGMLLWCGYQVLILHSMSSAAIIKMTLLLPIVTYPLESLASLSNSLRESLASAKRIFSFLDEPAPMRNRADAIIPPPFQNAIVLKDVSYRVQDVRILDNISFAIPRGSVLVLYGPSGAGKSTILSLLAAFIHCTGGEIEVDGADIRSFQAAKWRRQLGIVPQDCILLNGTVRQNLLYAKPQATETEMLNALNQAGINENSAFLRDGLETFVGNRGEMMSGGERQRLTIARALLNDPEILLLDEPTSMLDRDSKLAIGKIIRSVADHRTVVVASHDPYLKEIADTAIGLNAGRLQL